MRTSASIVRFAPLALVATTPAAALAAEGANQNPLAFELIPYVSTILVFGVVFFILSKYVWPHVLKALEAREQKIRAEIDDAERARKQANAALQQYEAALAEARSEASKMLEQAKAEQQKLAGELRAKTEQELNAMRESAKRDIEAAKRAAVAEVYSHMTGVATAIASRILQREINADDQKRLVEESMGELQAAQSN